MVTSRPVKIKECLHGGIKRILKTMVLEDLQRKGSIFIYRRTIHRFPYFKSDCLPCHGIFSEIATYDQTI